MSKTVFAFGRMNPPTIGHEKLADKVASEAKRRGAMPHIYLSHTQNSKKDPLPYNVKIAIAKKAFGKAVTKSSARNIIEVVQELEKMGHTEITLIAGSDRIDAFKTLLNKYNGKDYNFDKIDVVSAGERDPDAEGVAGMSASKLRGIAQAGDYDTFAKGMPSKLRDSDKKKVYDTIRSVMEEWDEPDPSDEELDEILSELDNDDDLSWEWDEDQLELDLDEARKPLTLAQRMKKRILMRRLAPVIARKRKITMRRKAGREQLTKRARRAALLLLKKRVAGNKGKKYKSLSPSEKIGIDRLVQKKLGLVDKIARRLLPKMLKKETERMRKKSSGVNEEFEKTLNELYFKVDVEGMPAVYIEAPSASTIKSDLRKVIRDPGNNIKDIERVERGDIVKAFRLRAQNPSEPLKVDEQKVAQDPDIKDRPGRQKKTSFTGLSKSTKIARDRHFKRMEKGSDDDPSSYRPAPGDAEGKTKPSKHTKKFKQMFGEEVTAKQISDLEKFGDRLLAKFDVDIEFSRHFADRMNDSRNNPEIKVAEIQALFKKIARKKAANIKKHANSEVVLKDIQKDLNLPIAIKMDKDGEIDVVHKTIMRKKNFKTPNAVVQYEDVNEAFEAEYLEEKQIDALKKKAEKTGISYSILKQVYNRGMAAWRTSHRPGTTPQQWAFARVNSFATKSKGTWGGADKDLAAKAQGSMKKEEVNEADPCWDGYKQVGMKKNAAGKDVPNCVPESVDLDESALSALRVATAAHKGQKRKSGGDYISHPKEVARIVKQYKNSHNLDALIQAAYLHDTIEDTDTTYKDLVKQFGGLVAGMVKDLTSDKDAIEAMGKGEYMANKMAKMSSWSLVIKLADRLANVGDIDDRPAEFQKKYANQTKLAIDTLKRDRYLSKTHKKIISAIEDKIKEYVTESVDEKVEFETDKDLPNLRKPKKTTNYEFNKYLSKLKGSKSREKDYFKSNPRFEENGGAGDEGTDKLVKKYKKDTPMQEEDDGAQVSAEKERHRREKQRLQIKHDREMDAARLRDTRAKNINTDPKKSDSMNEAFEMAMQTQAGMGETMFAKDFMQIRAGYEHHPDVEAALEEEPCCDDCLDEDYGWEEDTDFVAIDESAAEYQGRKVKLNNPTRSDNPKKKTMVYVKNEKGNVVKVYFGDPNLSIKRDDPGRRKNFRARHNCDNPGPKWKARYWSCKFWSSKKVSDLMKG